MPISIIIILPQNVVVSMFSSSVQNDHDVIIYHLSKIRERVRNKQHNFSNHCFDFLHVAPSALHFLFDLLDFFIIASILCLLDTLPHLGLDFCGILDLLLQSIDLFFCNLLQVLIATIFSSLEVGGVVEALDCGSLLRLFRHTAMNKLIKLRRGCLGTTKSFFTFEKEEAFLR